MSEDVTAPPPSPVNSAVPLTRKRRGIYWLLGLLGALIVWNGTVTVPVALALWSENSHTVVTYRRWLVSPSQIVVDVWHADSNGSMADMDRLLFKSAEALKQRQYDGVVLAYHGVGRLILDGSHFRTIGQEFAYQNPVYTMRTLTEHVANMDGSPAFGTWTGGWLGVLSHQVDDHNKLHEQWWVSHAMEGGR